MARVKPIAINYAIFVNPFATYVVKTAQIHSWWYEEIAWIVPAQRNSSLPHAYISVLNEWSQLVLPTVPNFRLGSGSGANPEPDSCNRFYHMRTRTIAIGPVLAPKSRHFNPTNLVPIEYLSSHRIMTWSICRFCSISRSFTSSFQICDPTNIRLVAIKSPLISHQIWHYFAAIQLTFVALQIWIREVKELLKLNNLHLNHVTFRSELNHSLADKVLSKL